MVETSSMSWSVCRASGTNNAFRNMRNTQTDSGWRGLTHYASVGKVTQTTRAGASAGYSCMWLHDPTTGRLTHRTFGWLSAFSSALAGVDYSYDRPGRLTKMNKGLVRWEYQYRAAAPYEMTAFHVSANLFAHDVPAAAESLGGSTALGITGDGQRPAPHPTDHAARRPPGQSADRCHRSPHRNSSAVP